MRHVRFGSESLYQDLLLEDRISAPRTAPIRGDTRPRVKSKFIVCLESHRCLAACLAHLQNPVGDLPPVMPAGETGAQARHFAKAEPQELSQLEIINSSVLSAKADLWGDAPTIACLSYHRSTTIVVPITLGRQKYFGHTAKLNAELVTALT